MKKVVFKQALPGLWTVKSGGVLIGRIVRIKNHRGETYYQSMDKGGWLISEDELLSDAKLRFL